MTAKPVARTLGAVALLLILGALGFQYLGGLAPCEMCHWQRWPLIAAAVLGLVGTVFARGDAARALALLVILLVAASGAIGAYQAGVEWHFLPGPTACTAPRFVLRSGADLNAVTVRCDAAAWRLFGISLAGYNAIVSLGAALLGALALSWRRR